MIRHTKKREILIDIIKKENKPLTATNLYDICKEKNIPINLSTIYRFLNDLLNNNILIKEIRQDKNSYYEFNTKKHKHHIICEKCHKEVPLDICPLNQLENQILSSTGYKITSHTLEFRGICKECRNKK